MNGPVCARALQRGSGGKREKMNFRVVQTFHVCVFLSAGLLLAKDSRHVESIF